MKPIFVVATVVVVALTAVTAAAGYHGQLRVDYRYTSGGAVAPGSPADIEQTAHLVFTVKNNRIVHMHGVVGFDWKEILTGCPNFTAETSGGGTVDAAPEFGIDPEFYPRWTKAGSYSTPEPSAPPAHVTSKSTTPANDCSTLNQTDQATFQLSYMTAVSGKAAADAKRVQGGLVRNLAGYDACHPFSPLPPPPPHGVSCTWRYRWDLRR